MTRVLVTGTSGFIGGHVAALLAVHDYEVLGIDKREPRAAIPGVTVRTCDLLDARALRTILLEFRPEHVIHLAARTDLNEKKDLRGYAANILGVRNLARAVRCTPNVRRVLCTSTQLVCRVGYRPAHDQDFDPQTLYGASKVLTERIWRRNEGGGTEWCIVRPTTIWGPWMNPHYLTFFRMVQKGYYFHIGRGRTLKSYGYVGNAAHQLMRLLEAPAESIHGRVFYAADYQPIALEDWAEAFQRELRAPRIRRVPPAVAVAAARMGDVVNRMGMTGFPFNSFRLRNVRTPYLFDLEPTRAVCGPLPYTLQDGVAETGEWLRRVWRLS
jgi:nucleoside-diphosphate-sugar epimerase